MRMGMTAYLGPAARPPRAARLRQLLRLPAPASSTRRSAASSTALGDPGEPGLAALADGRRPLRRPRRDGALPRRPAPEDVQRLRGDDQRPARRLQPGPVPASRRRPTRSPRWSTCCRRCSTLAGATRRRTGSRGRDLSPVLAGRRASPSASAAPRGAVDLGPVLEHPAPAPTRPGRDPLHLRRPPGRHRDAGGARAAEPDPRGPHRRTRKYARLLRPRGPGGAASTSCTTSSATRDELDNLVDVRDRRGAARLTTRCTGASERLTVAMAEAGDRLHRAGLAAHREMAHCAPRGRSRNNDRDGALLQEGPRPHPRAAQHPRFESRTEVWREVGLGERDRPGRRPAGAPRGRGLLVLRSSA